MFGRDVNTRGGVFGGGGYGGGVFSGMSGLAAYEQAAAGVRGLGALTIPSSCKDRTEFVECWSKYYPSSADYCADHWKEDGHASADLCVDTMMDANAYQYCSDKCPEIGPSRGKVEVGPIYVSGSDCSEKSTIKFVQWNIGTAVDGIWGPKSRAALEKSGKSFREIAAGCTGTAPGDTPSPVPKPDETIPVDVPPPATTPPATYTPPPPPKVTGISTAWMVGGILAAVAAVGAGVYYSRK